MIHNYIGIDPSIISTGMVVNGKVFNYCRRSEVFGKAGKYSKWFDLFKDVITYRYIELNYLEGYSENEVQKIRLYDSITDMIMSDIIANLQLGLPIKVAIESYSYSSTGDIIDLVTFSTLLRRKLLTLTEDIDILAPTTLKLEACKMTYPPKDVGKKKPKFEYRNNQGISGGRFQKPEMSRALIENDAFQEPYCRVLRDNQTSILFTKTVKKPMEDCSDSMLLYQYLVKKNS